MLVAYNAVLIMLKPCISWLEKFLIITLCCVYTSLLTSLSVYPHQTHTHTHTRTYIHTHTYTHKYINTNTHNHTLIRTHINTQIQTHIHTKTKTHTLYLHTRTQINAGLLRELSCYIYREGNPFKAEHNMSSRMGLKVEVRRLAPATLRLRT